MCGILGSVNIPIEHNLLNLIKHRGPDGHGLINNKIGMHSLSLGHRRLAIVDLSANGHQPMLTTGNRHTIIFNGEIYNHLDLRSKIEDVAFRGHSDAETILHYITRFGIDSVSQFNGIFSLAFMDATTQHLYLCRDPFGVKPLYYWHKGGSLIFSSEIRPIQQLVQDTIDPANLAELLRLRYSPSPDTLFKNIRKVRPGHTVTLDLSKPELSITEAPFSSALPAELTVSFNDAVEQYGHLFQEAVERQLMSDVEMGILLSGGIDSALVAKYAQEKTSRPMKAFTVGFKNQDESDEIKEAHETASYLGLEHIVTRIGFDDFLESIRGCIGIVEEPLATTSIIPMYYLSKLASQKVKVILSGQGADEPLGGYGRYQGELYRCFFPPILAKIFKPLAKLVGVRNDQILRGLDTFQHMNDIPRFLSAYSVFHDDKIEKLIGIHDHKSAKRLQYTYDLLECVRRKNSVERMMAVDLRMNLADDLLLYTDKITMHHSLECRVPMLDLELVRFIESLPYNYRVKLWRTKIIHRDFARKVLPESIINRKKKGFQSPTKIWFRRSAPLLREILLDHSSRFANFFDLAEINNVLKEHENGFNCERQIFLLLGLYFWMEEFA